MRISNTSACVATLCLIFSLNVKAQKRSDYDLAAWLIAAVHDNDTVKANWALKQGMQIDYPRSGQNALHNAIYKRNRYMVDFLLRKGASVDSLNDDGMNALQYAQKIGDPGVIELIKQKMGIADHQKAGAPKKEPAPIKFQARSDYDLAAWLIAAVNDKDTVKANWALEQGNPIDYPRAGQNALHNAIYNRNKYMVEFLLRKGASIQSVNEDGLTALQYAEKIGDPGVLQLIKEKSGISTEVKKPAVPVKDLVQPVTRPVAEEGKFKQGDTVLHSRDRGRTWEKGIIKEVSTNPLLTTDNAPLYVVENMTKTSKNYLDINFLTTLNRKPEWTSFFTGDWDLYLPIAATERIIDRDVYQIISGGDRLPPLRINANNTYSWVIDKNKVIRGTWKANDKGPGVILLKGDRAVDWLVYNTSDAQNRKIYKKDYIMIVSDAHYITKHGFRVKG
jgi:ankyrin repeat protein